MRPVFKSSLGACAFLLLSSTANAGPWWTGPLLAPAGHTIPKGHSNLELYGFFTENDGTFDQHWKFVHTPANRSTVFNPVFSHGLTDSLDIQFSVPYAYNRNQGQAYRRVSDTGVTLGYQLLEQKDSKWIPDLRVTIGEIIPTGNFEDLDPVNNGTDATGSGSYQTAMSLNFQHLLQVFENHWLRTRLSLSYVYSGDVQVRGINSYGGTPNTFGEVDPGNQISADLAAEFNVTQNWVAVMEGFIANRTPAVFKGFPGTDSKGQLVSVGHGTVDSVTLAPAIEYNFNANVGVIGGYWYTITGRDTSDFHSVVVALNAYW
ncbi:MULTISPECIES: hypothetical protein [Legionella]|uniref:hypothetical protein n=1 Tax=Legionella TaxID=445 RepID=UPI001055CF77|nr:MULTISPECIES: hypothetical protein [Legionella]MCE3044937.1 hypothetical protein [Legionella sp. 16cNR16C]